MLAVVAVLMLVMRWLELIWQVEPNFAAHGGHEGHQNIAHVLALPGGPGRHRRDLALPLLRELKKRPLLPVNDPYLPEAIEANGH